MPSGMRAPSSSTHPRCWALVGCVRSFLDLATLVDEVEYEEAEARIHLVSLREGEDDGTSSWRVVRGLHVHGDCCRDCMFLETVNLGFIFHAQEVCVFRWYIVVDLSHTRS